MDSFYDIKGNEVSKDGIVAEFINNYEGNLTDFNEGSEIRNLLEAFAVYAMGNEERMNDMLYAVDIMNADGEYLDLLAGQPAIDMERIEGVEATGEVLFTVANALLEELLIPAGTVVSAENGMDFETITDNIIPAGTTSISCMVEAIEVGTEGNIPANTIVTKIDGYDAVQGFTVSNPDAFNGGLDYEEDDAFRDRILEHMSLQKFGSKPYYIAQLMNEFPDAHDILFDTSNASYTGVVTPNTYKGATAQAKLINDVQSYLSDDNNILIGHTFNVASPDEKTIDFIVVHNDWITSDDLKAKVTEVITKYITGGELSFAPKEYKGLNLGEQLTFPVNTECYELSAEVDNVFNRNGDTFVNRNSTITGFTDNSKYVVGTITFQGRL